MYRMGKKQTSRIKVGCRCRNKKIMFWLRKNVTCYYCPLRHTGCTIDWVECLCWWFRGIWYANQWWRKWSDEDLPGLGDQSQNGGDMQSSLADLAVSFGISLIARSAILSILKIHHPSLPKDGRTLLKTVTSYTINSVAGGMFHYCGILNSIEKILDKVWSTAL